VNFFLRGNLAVAAPVLTLEFGMSPWQLGLLLSAFFWTYSVSLIGAGWLVDRFEVRWVYAVGFLLWSFSTISTAFVTSFSALLGMRLLLGIGESVAYPANSRILATAFPENRRGLANALTDVGGRVGPFVGTLCGALLVTKAGWRGLFLISGIGALIWLVPWLIWAPQTIAPAAANRRPAVSWTQLLRRRDVWGTFGGLFGANYFWYFLLSYLPSYLVKERHFTMNSVALWGALPYLFMIVSSISGGILADRWISRGASPVRVRRGFAASGLVMSAVLLPLTLLPRVEWALAGLFLTCLAFGSYVSNLWALTQTLAGPQAAGRWTGMQNACGNVAGILSPMLTGWLVTKTGHYSIAFLAASAACLGGAASFGLLIRDPNSDRKSAGDVA
jgi:MFS transporter, ACS family, D-galactonate transporter